MVVIKCEVPIEPVEVGSVWTWACSAQSRVGHVFVEGETIKVLSQTKETPHGEVMERGYNLVIEASNGITVWATFEQCVSRGMLFRQVPVSR